MNSTAWNRLTQASSEAELKELQTSVHNGGYSAFHLLLEDFKQQLKTMQDEEVPHIVSCIQTARRLFPDPSQFSPSWRFIWEELEQIAAIKANIMQTIAPLDRNGEWQVILDNPYSVQGVVCHPGLTFHEAAYLYSYFRPGLERNEYIRLQKIQLAVTDVGT
ncbi:hypothetical protein [Paenibacillus rigui]|uniref:Uncharacterized protein n=1 Tax=Paenibacillus rigui TaxID=554312 RepID=A0A229UWX3_9BACL|nr:hypothetical protein [Paenibacillus rigui]OXM87751.1 hypothetical protein CF651_01120 [Paenibacillus rigui]